MRGGEGSGNRKRGRVPLPAFALRYAGLATGAVAALAVVLTVALGGGAAPSIAQAAALAVHGPVASAPVPDPQAPTRLLDLGVGSLQFPRWQGWQASGRRIDQLGNRTVKTVYYSNGRHRIAYSIVSAPALKGLRTNGEPYATMTQKGRTVVVWEERGHTCILSATGLTPAALWRLAVTT